MIFTSFLQYEKAHMSLNDHLVAMSETQPWTSFALRGLSFQFLGLNFQFLEGNFKTSEPCVYKVEQCQMPRYSRVSYHQKGTRTHDMRQTTLGAVLFHIRH